MLKRVLSTLIHSRLEKFEKKLKIFCKISLCAYFCGTFNQEVNKMKKIYFAIAACAIFAFAACSGSTETSNADTTAADTAAAAPAPEAAPAADTMAADTAAAAPTEAAKK